MYEYSQKCIIQETKAGTTALTRVRKTHSELENMKAHE